MRRLIVLLVFLALAGFVAACGGSSHPAAAPSTRAPATTSPPAAAPTTMAPSPTPSASASSPAATNPVLFAKSGSGAYTSSPFLVDASPLSATVSYYNCPAGSFSAVFVSGTEAAGDYDYQIIADDSTPLGPHDVTLYPQQQGADYQVKITGPCSWVIGISVMP
jgi:hypothetical protein